MDPLKVERITLIYHLSDGSESRSSVVAEFRMEIEEREHEGRKQERGVLTTAWKDQQFFDGEVSS